MNIFWLVVFIFINIFDCLESDVSPLPSNTAEQSN